MSLPDVLDANEILLNDQRYAIAGQVSVQGLGTFPPKVTIGDTTRDTAQLVSSINLGNFQGGWLHRILDAGQEPEWVWQSTADTRFRRQVTLPPNAALGQTGLASGPPVEWTKLYQKVGIVGAATDYTYAVSTIGTGTAENIISWHGSTWNLEHSGPAAADYQDMATIQIGLATDIIVGSSTGYSKQIGAGWVDVGVAGGPAGAACPAIVNVLAFGSTFYASDAAGYMWVLNDISTNDWTRGGAIPVTDLNAGGPIRKLISFRDKNGDAAIHVITRTGLYIYDTSAHIFRPTDLQFPYFPSTTYQRGVAIWRGDLYIAAGQSIFKYDGNVIENIGLDRVDGLPSSFAQPVRYLCDTYNWLVAATDFNIYAWDGTAWHLLWTSVGSATPVVQYIQDVNYVVADQGATTRLWWSTTNPNSLGQNGATLTRYLDMDRTLFNPRTSTTYVYQSSAYLISPWFTAGWDELDKLWLEVELGTEQVTGSANTDDRILLQYQINLQPDSDTTWTDLGYASTTSPTMLQFSTPQASSLGNGMVAKSIRFRANLTQSATTTNTPVLLYISVKFQRLLPRLYGYAFTVEGTQQRSLGGYETAHAWLAELQTAYETQTLLEASFRRDGQAIGNIPSRRVQISQFQASAHSGTDETFTASITLNEVG